MERLEQEVERAKRVKLPIGLLIIDIDLFKDINDTYGHKTGDFVLQKFSVSLVLNSRPYDVIGRYGGDEFIVCLPNTDFDESLMIEERMRCHIEEMTIINNNVQHIKLTASFGVVSYSLEEDIDSLISRADCAMYKEKRQRNLVCSNC